MAQEFEGDLSESVFRGVDLGRARFRDVDLTGATLRNVRLVDVDVDGLVRRLVVNGVDVTDHVNAHDPWQPLRGMIRPDDVAGVRAAVDALEQAWSSTVDRARRLTEEQQHRSVDGEWSFVQTLRHLVFASDKWFTVPLGAGSFHPIGLPNTGSAGFGWVGLDPDADPSFDDVLRVRADRADRVRAYVESLTEDQLSRRVEVLENGRATVLECLRTVFEEEFEHRRYALRDLASFT